MSFITGGLEAEDYDRSYSDRELVRRIAGYFRPHLRVVLLVAAMVALASIGATIIPLTISSGVDALTGRPSLQLILMLAGLITLLGALNWVFNYIRELFAARAVGAVVLALREDAFAAVLRRDMAFFDEHASGRVVSRVSSDTQDFATVVTLVVDLLARLVLVVVIVTVMFFVEWRLALLTLLIAPIVIVVALGFRRLARRAMQQAQRAQANVNAVVQETISGIAVAKGFRREAAIYDDFQRVNALAYRVQLQRVAVFGSIFPLLNTISGLSTAVVVYVGGRFVLDGAVSVGDWYLFVQALTIFFYPLTSIASFWSQFQQGLAASERVFALIDAEPLVQQRDQAPVGTLAGAVVFRGVGFGYGNPALQGEEGPRLVLHDFSLAIAPGEALAIVGHTGAGKSSLIKLLLRFYEFQAGELLIDGRDIRTLDLSFYRRQIGYVPQAPFLFAGTVAENIRYGRPEASEAEVEAAARSLGDGSWVDDLPHGLASEVGERGARLSLGQRQLVALARVLFHRPAILLLDEATASIDPLTEAQVQAGLATAMRGRTSIVIAHRLSTVREADRIIVMRAGQIVEAGAHEALLAAGGHYAELYQTYFRHQEVE